MLEVLIYDKCKHSENATPLAKFCYEIMGYCCEPAQVRHQFNGTTELSTCLFKTSDEILSEVGSQLRVDERIEFSKLWADDIYPRAYEVDGGLLRIKQLETTKSNS